MNVDKIFIINLDHRQDRWSRCVEEMKKWRITNYERFSAIKPNIKDLEPKLYSNLVSPHRGKPRYICAAMGCKMSHYEIIKLSKARGYKQILILEDDVEFKDGWKDILEYAMGELPEEWHMLYLSGNHREKPTDVGRRHLKKVTNTLTTHSYILNHTIFDTLLNQMMEISAEIDNVYTLVQSQLYKSFTVHPGITTQAVSHSDVLDRTTNYKNVIS